MTSTYKKAIAFLDVLELILNSEIYLTELEKKKILECLKFRDKFKNKQVSEAIAQRLVPPKGENEDDWQRRKIRQIIGKDLPWALLFGRKIIEGQELNEVTIQFIDAYLDMHIDELYTGEYGALTPTRYETMFFDIALSNDEILKEFKEKYCNIYANYEPVCIVSTHKCRFDTYEYCNETFTIKKYL